MNVRTAPTAPIAPLLEVKEKTQRLVAAAAALGELTSLLIRSPEHSQYTIADMEWLVVPAVLNRQFLIVRAQSPGEQTPLPGAAVMWASVSDEFDAMFKQNPGQRFTLTAEQRNSGDNIWITDVVGVPMIWNRALDEMRDTVFKGKKVAMSRKEADGTMSVIEHQPRS
ncbi:MAG: toxin-activating lysine-acyltransferase [Hyphomicrobiaceae bacterium]